MSQFSNSTHATNGMLRSEIPAQFFNQIKTYALNLLDDLPTEHWVTCMDRISNWHEQDIGSELSRMKLSFTDIEENFRYTMLRTIKTIHSRNSTTP